MNVRRCVCLAGLLGLALVAATAQSSEFMDALLASDSVSVGQASYLVLVASDNIGEDADNARAFELLVSLGWAPKGSTSEQGITLAQYSYLLMKAFGLKGGLMYSMFPGPRYAYRELASRMVIQGRSDPSDALDGGLAVRMLGRVFDIKGVQQ